MLVADIIATLAESPELSEWSLRRKRAQIWRRQDPAILLIAAQRSPWWTGSSARFTVNAGVLFPAALQILRGRRFTVSALRWEDLTIRGRAGMIAESVEQWWTVGDDPESEPLDLVKQDVAHRVREEILPFLDHVATPCKALAWLQADAPPLGAHADPRWHRIEREATIGALGWILGRVGVVDGSVERLRLIGDPGAATAGHDAAVLASLREEMR